MISVVMPAYNREKTIGRAIESVLSQSYKDLELIVVDDCSTDGTEENVKSFKDERLRYYKLKKNAGACAARNFGVSKARGEYIAFQDSDDEFLRDKLERQLLVLERSGADVVVCAAGTYDEKEKFIKKVPRMIKKDRWMTYEFLLGNTYVSTQMILGKAECFREVQFDSEMPRLQDWDLILRLAKKYQIFYMNESLVKIYVQSDSITKNPEKGFVALEKIYRKHKRAIDADKEALANYYIFLAVLYKQKGNGGYRKYLMKALGRAPKIEVVLRVVKTMF